MAWSFCMVMVCNVFLFIRVKASCGLGSLPSLSCASSFPPATCGSSHSVPISFDFRPVLAVMLRVSPDLSNLLYWGCKNQGWYLGYWQYEGEEDDLEDEWLELGGTTLRVVVMVLLLQQVGCFIQNIPSPRVTCQTYLVGRWKPK